MTVGKRGNYFYKYSISGTDSVAFSLSARLGRFWNDKIIFVADQGDDEVVTNVNVCHFGSLSIRKVTDYWEKGRLIRALKIGQ